MIPDQTILSRFSPGAVHGKYRFLREIGRGGMGVVYLAEDTGLGRQVALKVLRTAWTSDEDLFTQRFKLEARAIAALYHPYIVRINSFDTVADRPTIEMEFLDGGSLADRLALGAAPFRDVLSLVHNVLEALGQCHAIGIVHRDVKPSNILVDSQGHARLTDFGLAKALSEHLELTLRTGASSGFFLGTPRYAPPEAWEAAEPTPAWDVYSLGMVLYEGITGTPAFDAVNPLALVKQVSSRAIPRLAEQSPHVSEELDALVHDMLQADPLERPADGQEALARFESLPECEGRVLSRASAVTLRASRLKPRRMEGLRRAWKAWRGWAPWLERVVLAFAVVAVVILVPWWVRSSSEEGPVEMPLAQSAVAQEELASAAELLRLSKAPNPASYLHLDAYLMEDPGQSTEWLMYLPEGGTQPATILGYTPFQISYLKVDIGRDRKLEFSGNWAQYEPSRGNVFRDGSVTGVGYWPTESDSLTAVLNYACEDGSRWTWTITGKPAPGKVTDTAFLHGLESRDLLPPLLYNELLERPLSWARQFEAKLPSVAEARTQVPYVAESFAEVTVDGRIGERPWLERHFSPQGRIGILAGRPGPRQPDLLLHSGREGLFLALRAYKALPGGFELRVNLLRRFSIPASGSDRWEVAYRGGDWLEHRFLRRGVEQDWECRWKVATAAADGDWTAEVFIPFDDFAGMAPPEEGDRWRLNCTVSDVSDPAAPKPLLQWGYPDPARVEHGAVLEFGPRTVGPAQP